MIEDSATKMETKMKSLKNLCLPGYPWNYVVVYGVFMALAIQFSLIGIIINMPVGIVCLRFLFLFFCLSGVFFLTDFISKKGLKRTAAFLLSFVLFLVVLIHIMELYSFLTLTETFNNDFYREMFDYDCIKENLPLQKKYLFIALFSIMVVLLFFNALLFVRHSFSGKGRGVSLCISIFAIIMLACFGSTALGSFIQMCHEANAAYFVDLDTISQKEMDPSFYESIGISVCDVDHDNLVIESEGIGKNLVFIILESMEANFLDEELFPGLTPNLNRFRKDKDTLNFTDMNQYASNTNESMFQTFWGFPSISSLAKGHFISEINVEVLKHYVSLPYIFYKAGYTWDHFQISSLAVIRNALEQEHISLDYPQKLNLGTKFKGRDKNMFDYAWTTFEQKMNADEQRFVISISTIDTHTPNGIVDEQTLEYPYKDKFPFWFPKFTLLDAAYTTDHYLGEFVDKVLSSKYGKDTIIIIMNDHFYMGSAGMSLNKRKRNNIFMILNTGRHEDIPYKGCQIDIAPTILDFFEIRTNYVFPCGVSLLEPPKKEYFSRVLDTSKKRILDKITLMKKAGIKMTASEERKEQEMPASESQQENSSVEQSGE